MPRVPLPSELDVDVLVVGGGINGCGIARDVAGRGWSVALCEQDDLASHTSSSSTKLVHGGLRYLEHFDFAFVRKSLREREVLLRSAPHLMWPLRFVMPHDATMRPAWMIRVGLFLYDHLARRELLPASCAIDLRSSEVGAVLKPIYRRGFVYSDGWVDDARLVVAAAIDSRAKGADIRTRTRCVDARRGDDRWDAVLEGNGAERCRVRARVLVNAAGPWAERFLTDVARSTTGRPIASRRLRLVRGSHIVVRRRFAHDHAYLLQSPDRRIVFAIPYEQDFTLIGTTDVEVDAADPARTSDAEIAYLCEQVSRYFREPIAPSDVVWHFAGIRPLLDDAEDDPSSVTRDYLLEEDAGAAPLLSVWGGKITTFRKLAEEAGDAIGRLLGDARPAWTRGAVLAGGDLADGDFAAFVDALGARHPWMEPALALRYARAYGTRVALVVGNAASMADLGAQIAPGVFERELRYLVDEEWCVSGDDVLWRRSKLGLRLGAGSERLSRIG